MKLQQLRFLKAIAENGLNISEAAVRLHTSQPGVSKQVRLLEDELGVQIFQRSGKHLIGVTPVGRLVLDHAGTILGEVENIRAIAADARDESRGDLRIATTHTQARYVLPRVIEQFRERYPQVTLHLNQGNPRQIAEMAAAGEVDFAIATEAIVLSRDLVMMPCYRWGLTVVTPPGHPLTEGDDLTLADIAAHPIVTYVVGFTGRAKQDADFRAAGLEPDVVFTAADADVIKTYVRLGLGVGIIAHMAYEPAVDTDLVAIGAARLFTPNTTKIGFRRGIFLRRFMYDFVQLFAPHLTREVIDAASHASSQEVVDHLLAGVELPHN